LERKIDKLLLDRFSTVFTNKLWGETETISGPGSRKDNPMVMSALAALEFVIKAFDISSIADIPCGDFNFFSSILDKHTLVSYSGYDIVGELIEQNRIAYPNLRFEQFDIVSDVPPTHDLIFCKELLIHLTNDQIKAALSNMKRSGSKYFMASNSFGVENIELTNNILGYARPVDLLREPFNFPAVLWNNNFYGFWSFTKIS
jgi:hypothetical protein